MRVHLTKATKQSNHRADVRLNGDSHDGGMMDCAKCYEPVTLEWDGGVTFHGVEHICKLYNS
jgi:hypothetical protein